MPPLAAVILAIIAIIWLIRRQHRLKEERMWRINFADLKWDDPVVVLGQGSCGTVTKATYRGTTVAIKATRYGKNGAETPRPSSR